MYNNGSNVIGHLPMQPPRMPPWTKVQVHPSLRPACLPPRQALDELIHFQRWDRERVFRQLTHALKTRYAYLVCLIQNCKSISSHENRTVPRTLFPVNRRILDFTLTLRW